MSASKCTYRIGRVVAATVAILLAASCSTSETSLSPDTSTAGSTDLVSALLQANLDAGSGRIGGTIDGADASNTGDLHGTWSGDQTGEGSVQAEFLSDSTKVPVELRWLDNTLYIDRADMRLASDDKIAAFARRQDVLPWREVPMSSAIVTMIPAAFSPPALLQVMQQRQIGLVDKGVEQVGDSQLTHLAAERPMGIGIWGEANVDLWADEQNRVVRVEIANPAGGARYDVSDFGTPVDVQPPPADQISNVSEEVQTQPDGELTVETSGNTNGVSWSLEKAPGTNDTTCWRWTATPPLAQDLQDPARCLKAIAPDADVDGRVQFLVFGNGQGPYTALAVALPDGVKELELGYVGGKTETVPVAHAVRVGRAFESVSRLPRLDDGGRHDRRLCPRRGDHPGGPHESAAHRAGRPRRPGVASRE